MQGKNLKIIFSLILIFSVLFIAVAVKKNLSYKKQKIEAIGEDYFKENNFKEAISCWGKALEINPKNLEIYQKLGLAYVRNNQIEEAIDIYEKGLKLDDKNCDLYYALAFSQLLKNNYLSSLKNLDKIIYLNSLYPEAHYLKGIIYEKQGLNKLAHQEFIKEINVNPSSLSSWKKIKNPRH